MTLRRLGLTNALVGALALSMQVACGPERPTDSLIDLTAEASAGAATSTVKAPSTPTPPPSPASEATLTPTPTAAFDPAQVVYTVNFVPFGDTLNARTGPGVEYGVSGGLWNGEGVRATGPAEQVGDELWLPIEYPYLNEDSPGFNVGWVNRSYLVRVVATSDFCADARAAAIVEEVRASLREHDSARLAAVVSPKRGLSVGGTVWSGEETLTHGEVAGFFEDSSPRSWGVHKYDNNRQIAGSIQNFIVPLMKRDILAEDARIACDDNQYDAAITAYLGESALTGFNFYSIFRPSPGDFNFGGWALGMEYWDDTPELVFVSYYEWEP